MKPALFHSDARAELDEAIAFYESRARGLGLDLQMKVENAVAEIRQNPEAWPPHKNSGFRRRSTERFPFAVFLHGAAGLHLDRRNRTQEPTPRLLEDAPH